MIDFSELKKILKNKEDFELSDQADLIPNFENEIDSFIYELKHPEKVRQWRISDFKKHALLSGHSRKRPA